MSTPEIFDRFQAEAIEWKDKHDFGVYPPYLTAAFREVARLYSGLLLFREVDTKPWSLSFLTSNKATINSIVPVGEKVAFSPLITSRSQELFGETASSYMPERWIEDPEKMAGHLRRHEMNQWGGGVHACKGIVQTFTVGTTVVLIYL